MIKEQMKQKRLERNKIVDAAKKAQEEKDF